MIGRRALLLPPLLGVALAASAGPGCAGWPPSGTAGAAAAPDGARVRPGAEAIRRLSYPPLRFRAPEPERFELSNGITVFFLADHTLPLANLFIDIQGGYTYFGRDDYAAGSALLPLMRHGGTRALTPDSIDAVVDYHALGVNTYSDGDRILIGVSGLRRHFDLAAELWSDILLRPRFDPAAMERWRVREIDAVRHLGDFPGSLAVLEFNRILYGDHPTGWMLAEPDLAPQRLDRERLRELHRLIVCPERAVIGAAGALTREELEATLERALAGWEPCGTDLEPAPTLVVRADPSIYIIPKTLSQSTIVVGQPGGVLLGESDDYFASRVANWVIGGSGPTSRLEATLRGEEGLAYSASSVWGVARDHERIFGAITHTRAESTIEAVRMLLVTLNRALVETPARHEVALARESISNGFVFGFGSAAQIVARRVSYEVDGLPADWMERYLDGIQRVDSARVARVLRRRLHPDRYTILIVGDTAAFDAGALGAYRVLPGR
jgi:zinc protease